MKSNEKQEAGRRKAKNILDPGEKDKIQVLFYEASTICTHERGDDSLSPIMIEKGGELLEAGCACLDSFLSEVGQDTSLPNLAITMCNCGT